jgi:hypothetical protein
MTPTDRPQTGIRLKHKCRSVTWKILSKPEDHTGRADIVHDVDASEQHSPLAEQNPAAYAADLCIGLSLERPSRTAGRCARSECPQPLEVPTRGLNVAISADHLFELEVVKYAGVVVPDVSTLSSVAKRSRVLLGIYDGRSCISDMVDIMSVIAISTVS